MDADALGIWTDLPSYLTTKNTKNTKEAEGTERLNTLSFRFLGVLCVSVVEW